MTNDGFQIEKRTIKAGTHPAEDCWFITSQDGRFVEQGPYGSAQEALADTCQASYEERSFDFQLTFDMVTKDKVIDYTR